MPVANVIQLRQLLSERFPGLVTSLTETASAHRWQTGVPRLDHMLHGGLPRSALTEIISEEKSAGSAFLMSALLNQAANENQIIAVIDGLDSLDVTGLDESTLAHLVWIRCHSAEEAMKAADILLRDSNVSLVLLDLIANPSTQLRRIPATVWYRLQRLIEETPCVCAVFTPWGMVSPAKARVTLHSQHTLDSIECDHDKLFDSIDLKIFGARGDIALPEHSIA